jgi:hypothetical protein
MMSEHDETVRSNEVAAVVMDFGWGGPSIV